VKNGLTSKYYYFGYCKNPKDTEIGKYAYKIGKNDEEIAMVDNAINSLVQSMEDLAKPFFRDHSLIANYKLLQHQYNIPSINESEGIATQFIVSGIIIHRQCTLMQIISTRFVPAIVRKMKQTQICLQCMSTIFVVQATI
jgi:hypothetical protein